MTIDNFLLFHQFKTLTQGVGLFERDVTERDSCFSQTQACPAYTPHRPKKLYYGPPINAFLELQLYQLARTSLTFLLD